MLMVFSDNFNKFFRTLSKIFCSCMMLHCNTYLIKQKYSSRFPPFCYLNIYAVTLFTKPRDKIFIRQWRCVVAALRSEYSEMHLSAIFAEYNYNFSRPLQLLHLCEHFKCFLVLSVMEGFKNKYFHGILYGRVLHGK